MIEAESYDAQADELFERLPDGVYEIAGFRDRPTIITVERVPTVMMELNGKLCDVSKMMPKVRKQVAERCLETMTDG